MDFPEELASPDLVEALVKVLLGILYVLKSEWLIATVVGVSQKLLLFQIRNDTLSRPTVEVEVVPNPSPSCN